MPKNIQRKPREFLTVKVGKHERTISPIGYDGVLFEQHLVEHLSKAVGHQWCRIECAARTMFGRNTPRHCRAIRKNLPVAFRRMLSRYLLTIEYAQGKGTHGEAIACKLYQGASEDERQHAHYHFERMRKRYDITGETLTRARAWIERPLGDEAVSA